MHTEKRQQSDNDYPERDSRHPFSNKKGTGMKTADVLLPSEYKRDLLNAVAELERALPKTGSMHIYIQPIEASSVGDRVKFLDVPEIILELLRKKSVPFEKIWN